MVQEDIPAAQEVWHSWGDYREPLDIAARDAEWQKVKEFQARPTVGECKIVFSSSGQTSNKGDGGGVGGVHIDSQEEGRRDQRGWQLGWQQCGHRSWLPQRGVYRSRGEDEWEWRQSLHVKHQAESSVSSRKQTSVVQEFARRGCLIDSMLGMIIELRLVGFRLITDGIDQGFLTLIRWFCTFYE